MAIHCPYDLSSEETELHNFKILSSSDRVQIVQVVVCGAQKNDANFLNEGDAFHIDLFMRLMPLWMMTTKQFFPRCDDILLRKIICGFKCVDT